MNKRSFVIPKSYSEAKGLQFSPKVEGATVNDISRRQPHHLPCKSRGALGSWRFQTKRTLVLFCTYSNDKIKLLVFNQRGLPESQ